MISNYWKKIILTVLALAIVIFSYLWSCDGSVQKCLYGNSILFTRTVFHLSLAFLSVASFLFFVCDAVFLKWLRFTGIWFLSTILFIMITPEYSNNILALGMTKKPISLTMSALFLPVSLVWLLWDSKRKVE